MPARFVTPEQIAQAARWYVEDKLSTIQIGNRMKLSSQLVCSMLRDAGVQLRRGAAAQRQNVSGSYHHSEEARTAMRQARETRRE